MSRRRRPQVPGTQTMQDGGASWDTRLAHSLVREVTARLDLDAGLRDVLAQAQTDELVREVTARLDLDAGLREIIPSIPATPSELTLHGGPEPEPSAPERDLREVIARFSRMTPGQRILLRRDRDGAALASDLRRGSAVVDTVIEQRRALRALQHRPHADTDAVARTLAQAEVEIRCLATAFAESAAKTRGNAFLPDEQNQRPQNTASNTLSLARMLAESVADARDRARGFVRDRARGFAGDRARTRARTRDLDRARDLALSLARDLDRARDLVLDLDRAGYGDLDRARDLARDLDRDLDRAGDRALDLVLVLVLPRENGGAYKGLAEALAGALQRAEQLAAAVSAGIAAARASLPVLGTGRASLAPALEALAAAAAHGRALQDLAATVNDYVDADLRDVDFAGIVSLDGIRWNEYGTRWPESLLPEIRRSSQWLVDDVYEIQEGTGVHPL